MHSRGWLNNSPPRLYQLKRRHRVCFSTLAGLALLQQSTPTELVEGLTRLVGTDHSLSTAYSKEENGIVERANQEVLRHLTAILFDTRVSNAWSYEQLPMVQRIMNTVEKTSTGVLSLIHI